MNVYLCQLNICKIEHSFMPDQYSKIDLKDNLVTKKITKKVVHVLECERLSRSNVVFI